jgi:hypothetical protein
MNDDLAYFRNMISDLRRGNATQKTHARAIERMFDTEQGFEGFQHSCVAIPVRETGQGWELVDPDDEEMVMGCLYGPFVEATPPTHRRLVENKIKDTLKAAEAGFSGSDQVVVPVLLIDTATWLLFYRKEVFDNAPTSGILMTNVMSRSPAEISRTLNLSVAKGDPVRYYYNQLKKEG